MPARMPYKHLLAILLLLGGVRALAYGPVDDAVNRLSTAGVFAFGGVGFAGTTSRGELDLRFLLSQPEPIALNALESCTRTAIRRDDRMHWPA
jgi:hypothetical protein